MPKRPDHECEFEKEITLSVTIKAKAEVNEADEDVESDRDYLGIAEITSITDEDDNELVKHLPQSILCEIAEEAQAQLEESFEPEESDDDDEEEDDLEEADVFGHEDDDDDD
jgi:hypothetical protein